MEVLATLNGAAKRFQSLKDGTLKVFACLEGGANRFAPVIFQFCSPPMVL